LIGLACVGTVIFTTRTGLAIHQDAIEVLHLIGAHDGFVARAFERNALWMGLRGGLIGLGLGALTFVVVGQVSAGLEAPLMPRFSLTPGGLMVLGSLPLVSAAIAMVTARFTVLRALADMP
ncbi:MAG: cell division protein, partial [Alphaproteobacteria bacterium]